MKWAVGISLNLTYHHREVGDEAEESTQLFQM